MGGRLEGGGVGGRYGTALDRPDKQVLAERERGRERRTDRQTDR